MSEKKTWPVMLIAGLLIAGSTTASFVSSRKHVVASCRDIRVAMDGGFSAVVESGGLTATSELTIYQEHNRKRIKVEKVPVVVQRTGSYVGDGLKLEVLKRSPASGKTMASLEGEIRGERVSATLNCSD